MRRRTRAVRTEARIWPATSSRNCTIGNHLLAEELPRGRFYHAPTSPVTTYSPCPRRHLEHFQFETLRIANPAACRFAEKTRFFRLASGWAALCRRLAFSPFSKVKRSIPRRRPSVRTRPFSRPPGVSAGSKRRAGRVAMRHAGTDQGRGSSEDDRRAFRAMHTSSLVTPISVFWDRIFPSSCGLVASFFQSSC